MNHLKKPSKNNNLWSWTAMSKDACYSFFSHQTNKNIFKQCLSSLEVCVIHSISTENNPDIQWCLKSYDALPLASAVTHTVNKENRTRKIMLTLLNMNKRWVERAEAPGSCSCRSRVRPLIGGAVWIGQVCGSRSGQTLWDYVSLNTHMLDFFPNETHLEHDSHCRNTLL